MIISGLYLITNFAKMANQQSKLGLGTPWYVNDIQNNTMFIVKNAADSVQQQDHPLRHHRRRRDRNIRLDRGVAFVPAPLIPRRRDSEGFYSFHSLPYGHDWHGVRSFSDLSLKCVKATVPAV